MNPEHIAHWPGAGGGIGCSFSFSASLTVQVSIASDTTLVSAASLLFNDPTIFSAASLSSLPSLTIPVEFMMHSLKQQPPFGGPSGGPAGGGLEALHFSTTSVGKSVTLQQSGKALVILKHSGGGGPARTCMGKMIISQLIAEIIAV